MQTMSKLFLQSETYRLSNTSVRDFDLCLESSPLLHKCSHSYSHSQWSQNAAALHKTGREVTTKTACRSNYKGTDYFVLRKQIPLQGFFSSKIPLHKLGINNENAVASCIRHLPNFQVVTKSLTKGLKRLATSSLILEAQAECQWLRDFVEPWANWF